MGYYITEINSGGTDTAARKTAAVDDTILVAGVTATAGSKMLYNFRPQFDAEAVTRLKNAGYKITGKTNVGEFGLDVLGETSFMCPSEDDNGNLVGAAAALTASGAVTGALNVDLNGAPRRAAALAGVVFVKPTYGTVSRYGIIPCACSGEQIGVTAKNAAEAAELLAVVAGHDDKDGTSLPEKRYDYQIGDSVRGMRFGIPKEYLEKADPDVSERVLTFGREMAGGGASVEEFSFAEAGLAQPAWHILMSAETCSNLSRYDGIIFGYRTEAFQNLDELYTKSRTEAFSLLTKALILYGSDVLSKGRYEECYDKSLRVRRALRDKLSEIFRSYDCIIAPACSKSAYRAEMLGDSIDAAYDESFFTALASITGIPAVSAGGVQLMADSFKEPTLLTAAVCYERAVEAR
jgi:aspartyl-tRNA(Asn)/glutamyl-tRNA(Gln) amidotransferase subunit A